ncbi:phage replication protein [Escherichia coli]|nr:phage replication protein [Escherichia coli]
MSMELMVKAMKIRVGNPLRKLVLIKLADNASDQGECWPSYQHIADQCEISKRSVMNHIAALCESGLVKKVTRKGEKGNSSNIYLLHLDGAGDSLPFSECSGGASSRTGEKRRHHDKAWRGPGDNASYRGEGRRQRGGRDYPLTACR